MVRAGRVRISAATVAARIHTSRSAPAISADARPPSTSAITPAARVNFATATMPAVNRPHIFCSNT